MAKLGYSWEALDVRARRPNGSIGRTPSLNFVTEWVETGGRALECAISSARTRTRTRSLAALQRTPDPFPNRIDWKLETRDIETHKNHTHRSARGTVAPNSPRRCKTSRNRPAASPSTSSCRSTSTPSASDSDPRGDTPSVREHTYARARRRTSRKRERERRARRKTRAPRDSLAYVSTRGGERERDVVSFSWSFGESLLVQDPRVLRRGHHPEAALHALRDAQRWHDRSDVGFSLGFESGCRLSARGSSVRSRVF